MSGEKGFTYPAALAMIIIVSISLMVVQKQWSTIVKRDKEKELFFQSRPDCAGDRIFLSQLFKRISTISNKFGSSFKGQQVLWFKAAFAKNIYGSHDRGW
jgi:hypothetical protein